MISLNIKIPHLQIAPLVGNLEVGNLKGIHRQCHQLQTALVDVLDELGPQRKHFIGPESDHWQCLSVTHSLTNSLTPV